MPSVWNFVGVEARTALTAFVFQVSTASGAIAAGFRGAGDAPGRHGAGGAPLKRLAAERVESIRCLPYAVDGGRTLPEREVAALAAVTARLVALDDADPF